MTAYGTPLSEYVADLDAVGRYVAETPRAVARVRREPWNVGRCLARAGRENKNHSHLRYTMARRSLEARVRRAVGYVSVSLRADIAKIRNHRLRGQIEALYALVLEGSPWDASWGDALGRTYYLRRRHISTARQWVALCRFLKSQVTRIHTMILSMIARTTGTTGIRQDTAFTQHPEGHEDRKRRALERLRSGA